MTAAASHFYKSSHQPMQAAPLAQLTLEPAEGRSNAIVTRGVEMEFRSGSQRFQALKDINLEINRGAVQLLMGPSGSGKTTLLSILGGILTPTAGSVHLFGQNLTRMSRSQLARFRLQHVGFVFQEFNLMPALTAYENVELVLKLKGVKGRMVRQQSLHLLEQVGLADRAKDLPHHLSGGQKQRVAIARALAGNPEMIMADEPTAALDSHNGYAVITLLRQLAKEHDRTVVIVTHDPRIIDVADRVTYLEDGKVQDISSTRDAFPLSA